MCIRDRNQATIEKTFMDLMGLAKSMDQEEQRYAREGFSSDEELSLYDLLFSETLTKQEMQQIKRVAVDLLAKVKAKIAELDHWRDKEETKATVDNLIRDTLWSELPNCYDEMCIRDRLMTVSSSEFVNYTYQNCKEGAKMPQMCIRDRYKGAVDCGNRKAQKHCGSQG